LYNTTIFKILFLSVNLAVFAAGFYFIWFYGLKFSLEVTLSFVWLFIFKYYVKFITELMNRKRDNIE